LSEPGDGVIAGPHVIVAILVVHTRGHMRRPCFVSDESRSMIKFCIGSNHLSPPRSEQSAEHGSPMWSGYTRVGCWRMPSSSCIRAPASPQERACCLAIPLAFPQDHVRACESNVLFGCRRVLRQNSFRLVSGAICSSGLLWSSWVTTGATWAPDVLIMQGLVSGAI
jgi:hypothetical protein